jgi:hypothetical protein
LAPGLQHRIINGIYPPSKNFWLILEPFAEGKARSITTSISANSLAGPGAVARACT